MLLQSGKPMLVFIRTSIDTQLLGTSNRWPPAASNVHHADANPVIRRQITADYGN